MRIAGLRTTVEDVEVDVNPADAYLELRKYILKKAKIRPDVIMRHGKPVWPEVHTSWYYHEITDLSPEQIEVIKSLDLLGEYFNF